MAYKVFTNGSPLPASDLNTYLMNQSVMVFADSTARSAALTAPTEGMTTWLEDTNKLEVYTGAAWVALNSPITTQGDLIIGDGSGLPSRLGIGTNGQILTSNGTTATWTSPSSGGLTTISTTTLSGTSTSLTSIPGTYKALYLTIINPTHDASISATDSIRFRLNSDTGGNYYNTSFTATSVQQNTGLTTSTNAISSFGANGTDAMGFLEIWSYTSSAKKRFNYYGSTWDSTNVRAENNYAWTLWNDTSVVTSIQIISNAGNNFTGGTATLYGVS